MSEWLIDMIKEWVLAQVYATEAWVLEWITPYNVTGTLIPDATCTYFKAGTYGGKPYYKNTRAEWYLWWYGEPVNEWWISYLVGDTDNGWRRDDPNIEGDYAPFHYSGTAAVAKGYKYLCHGFIDRGDTADDDFTVGDFTKDGNWHELDLSGIVPAGAKSVLFKFFYMSTGASNICIFRTLGNTNDSNVSVAATQVANVLHSLDIVIPLDADRKIEYQFQSGTWLVAVFTVKGWWF